MKTLDALAITQRHPLLRVDHRWLLSASARYVQRVQPSGAGHARRAVNFESHLAGGDPIHTTARL